MKKIITLIILSFIVLYPKTTLATTSIENKFYEKEIYLENEYFLVEIGNENTFNIISKKNNLQLDKKWTNILILNNNNLLAGIKTPYNSYDYYEIDKEGKKNFIINTKYYIEDIHKETGSFIISQNQNNEKFMGVLDKEFKLIYEPKFIYKENAFKDNTEALQNSLGKFGLFSINGSTLIEPIFDNLIKNDKNNLIGKYKGKEYSLVYNGKNHTNTTALNSVDNWAKSSVEKAIELGIVSDLLQLNLKENITREEFCELAVKSYEIKTNFKIKTIKNPFIDTNNEYVIKAYSLGIVSGKENNKFYPKDSIKREEVAVILNNLTKKMGYIERNSSVYFKDKKEISSWAINSINNLYNLGILSGDTKGNFNPKQNNKVLEAISSITRLYDN